MNYKSITLFFLLAIIFGKVALGQVWEPQRFAIKTNLLSAPFGNINAGAELLMTGNGEDLYTDNKNITTLNFTVSYNPFTYSNNKKLKHIALQPELRFWKSPFNGFFWGIHVHYAYYNVGGIDLPFNIASSLKERRYQGQLFGTGFSAGYYFKYTERFRLETSIGVGYAYMDHDVYQCTSCGTKIGHEIKNYIGPTKAAIAVVYLIE